MFGLAGPSSKASAYHGLHCDDKNECASSPCQNGGSCTDSSNDQLVNDYVKNDQRYRCLCAAAFTGANCAQKVPSKGHTTGCQVSKGLKNMLAAAQAAGGAGALVDVACDPHSLVP